MSNISNFLNLTNYKYLLEAYENRTSDDINGDGKVDSKDKQLFKSLDVNGDGKINSKDKKYIKQQCNELQKLNDTYDLNGDGELDVKDFNEFSKIIASESKRRKYNISDDQVEDLKKLFIQKTLDSDNNGKINIVDLEYYYKMQNSLEAYLNKSSGNLDTFTKNDVDINGDGKVNKKDLEALKATVSALEEYTGVKVEFLTVKSTEDVDGEISDDYGQGNTGDCWLLAGVRALANTEKGAQILKDSIRRNDDGSVTVIFNGVWPAGHKCSAVSYTISADELKQHDTDDNHKDAYSNGDNDMLAIELACEKLHADLKSGKVKCGITSDDKYCQPDAKKLNSGGFSTWIIYYFTGVKTKVDGKSGHRRSNEKIRKFLEKNAGHLDSYALTFELKGNNKIKCTDGTYFKCNLGEAWHALTITKIDKKKQEVTFINPWYGDKEYTVSFKEFCKLNIGTLNKANISKAQTKSKVTDMTGYEPPENKQYTDEAGNNVVERTISLNGARFLEQRCTTAPDGTVTIENFQRKYFGCKKDGYQDVLGQKIVISPDGTTTTTDYTYELVDGKYVLKDEKVTVTNNS